jgi:hypothetical protein
MAVIGTARPLAAIMPALDFQILKRSIAWIDKGLALKNKIFTIPHPGDGLFHFAHVMKLSPEAAGQKEWKQPLSKIEQPTPPPGSGISCRPQPPNRSNSGTKCRYVQDGFFA